MITFLVISVIVGFIGIVSLLLFGLMSVMLGDTDHIEHLKE